MMLLVEKREIQRERNDNETIIPLPSLWLVRLEDRGRVHELEFDHDPTADEIVAQLPPRPQRLEPTVAAGKAALRDLLDEQVQEAHAWEWFSTKAAADTNLPAAAKTAVAALATAEYERAKRLLAAWRQAT